MEYLRNRRNVVVNIGILMISCAVVCNGNVINPQLSNLCKEGSDPGLCTKSILESLKGPFDPHAALRAEIDATLQATKRTIDVITKLLGSPSNTKSLNDCLTICKDQYGSILDSVNETLDHLSKNNIRGCQLSFSAIVSYQQTCEDAFTESPDVTFSFSADSKLIFNLASNSLAIMAALDHANAT